MPWTLGGAPVTIDRLLGLAKLGTTLSAVRFAPSRISRARLGARPSSTAVSM